MARSLQSLQGSTSASQYRVLARQLCEAYLSVNTACPILTSFFRIFVRRSLKRVSQSLFITKYLLEVFYGAFTFLYILHYNLTIKSCQLFVDD